jgi:hypothetical protein
MNTFETEVNYADLSISELTLRRYLSMQWSYSKSSEKR